MQILETLGLIIGGGVGTKAIDYFISKRTDKRSDFSEIVKQWQADNERLRVENQELKDMERVLAQKVSDLEKRLNDFQNKLVLLESAHLNLPVPMWLKDNNGIMMALNKAYEDAFLAPLGKSMTDYIGHDDTAIWDAETTAAFQRNDMAAMLSPKKVWYGTEPIIIKGNDISTKWRVIKYVRYAGAVPIGIGGIAIPLFD